MSKKFFSLTTLGLDSKLTDDQFKLLIDWLQTLPKTSETEKLIEFIEEDAIWTPNVKYILPRVYDEFSTELFIKFVNFIFVDLFEMTFVGGDQDSEFFFEKQFVSIKMIFNSLVKLDDKDFFTMDVSLKAGYMFGEFVIDRKIGAGGYGQVYACTDSNGERFAVKVQNRTSFGTEMKRLNKLKKVPNVVHPTHSTMFSVFGEEYWCFFMELYPNGTLVEYVNTNRCGMYEIMSIFLILLRTVCLVNEAGVIHCDIKPENIFVDSDGEPYLGDFGIAHVLSKGCCFGETPDHLYSLWWRDFWNAMISNSTAPNKMFRFTSIHDFCALMILIIDVASSGQFRTWDKTFNVFRSGSYSSPSAQTEICEAIDSIFSDPADLNFGKFFHKYLNIDLFMDLNRQMTENPQLEISLMDEALCELESLLSECECDDPGQKKTPLRSRHSHLCLDPIQEEEESGDEESDDEY